jgi:hypothetical protein
MIIISENGFFNFVYVGSQQDCVKLGCQFS